MHELHELKEMLCEELKEYGSKDKLDVGGLEIVDKLAHAIKNIDKIIEAYEEEEYSMEGDPMGGSYEGGGSYRRYYAQGGGGRYNRGGSYARGRGRNTRRDSMGRYSRAGEDMVMELRELMEDAPDDRIRQEFQKLIQKVEQM
jgi:hypothetical protein